MGFRNLSVAPTSVGTLTTGTAYRIQNLSSQNISVAVGTSVPNAESKDVAVLRPLEILKVTKQASRTIYVWNSAGFGFVSYHATPFG